MGPIIEDGANVRSRVLGLQLDHDKSPISYVKKQKQKK